MVAKWKRYGFHTISPLKPSDEYLWQGRNCKSIKGLIFRIFNTIHHGSFKRQNAGNNFGRRAKV